MFRGREITHREIGVERIDEMLETLSESGVPVVVERPITTEGRFMSVIVAGGQGRGEAGGSGANGKRAGACRR